MEKIKGVRGSYEKSKAIYEWLESQGGMVSCYDPWEFDDPNRVYFVIDGHVLQESIHLPTVKLLDVIELPE